MLSQLESYLDREITSKNPERENAYDMALEINSDLNSMEETVKQVVVNLNESSSNSTDPNNPVTTIVKILNAHTSALEWIKDSSVELESKIDVIKRRMKEKTIA